jgi:phage replication-related protein YjqB (UPF0714/DUF867 family)
MTEMTVAIAWFRPEDYQRIYALAPHGGGMEKTYEEWKEAADKAVVGLALEGIRAVVIDPAKFENWLKARRLKSSSAARARYATSLAKKLDLRLRG